MVDLKNLLAQMTLEEKIGQMIQKVTSEFTRDDQELTGVAAGDGKKQLDKHMLGSALGSITAATAIAVQTEHLKHDRNRIPLIFMRDVIHGHTTIYPIPLGMGCTFDPQLMEDCCRMTAVESSAGGYHLTFTPMVDYVRDPRWGRVMETCGEDPYLNGVMGAAQIRGFRGEGIQQPGTLATCVKHFAAYGGAEAGRDYNPAEVSEYSLREYYLPAYKACIDGGVDMVMPSFNTVNGVPVTGYPRLMLDLLREEWGFDGVVITDWGSVSQFVTHGFAEDLRHACQIAIDNQNDIEMCSNGYQDHLKQLVEEGKVSEAQIDRAVMRILKLKQKLGLFEDPFHGASEEQEKQLFLCPEHRALVRRAAQEAAILLKNDGVLPFADTVKHIALIGPFAREQAINGKWSCYGKADDCVSMEAGIAALLPNAKLTVVPGCSNLWDDTDTSGIDAAVEAARSADAVILCVGEPEGYSGEGNCRTDLRLPGVQEELVRRVCQANGNSAVVLFNGRPLVLTEVDKVAPAILEMWFPGTEGGNAAANLLFGKANPCGKVAMSFPKAVGQCPLYYNYTKTGHPAVDAENRHVPFASNYVDCGNLPLYCFGHGLSYTDFRYEDLELSADTFTAEQGLDVAITVRNCGAVAGKEVVQLYMRDHVGSTVRPVQELIDFQKILLQPGEEKTLCFHVDASKLSMWNSQGQCVCEPGLFSFSTGYADHLLLTKQARMTE